MNISKDKLVTLQYTLTTVDDGEEIEKTEENRPFVFLCGNGLMLEDFESNLLGLSAGDKFSFELDPSQAYGEFTEEAIEDLDINIFRMEDGTIDNDVIKEGNWVPLITQDGQQIQALILSIEEETVKMDFNHPLAGETLRFEGMIQDVREPSAHELEEINQSLHGGGCGCDNEEGCCNSEKDGENKNDHECGCNC